jgi:hypothetical protein
MGGMLRHRRNRACRGQRRWPRPNAVRPYTLAGNFCQRKELAVLHCRASRIWAFPAVLNVGTSTMILAFKHEIPRTDEEPPTNTTNAYVSATSLYNRRVVEESEKVPGTCEEIEFGPVINSIKY